MARGIKDKVAIIGMGCTPFGEHWNKGPEDLMVDAFVEAIAVTGLDKVDRKALRAVLAGAGAGWSRAVEALWRRGWSSRVGRRRLPFTTTPA